MWLKSSSQLQIAIGWASQAGRRPDNQDFVSVYQGTPAERVTHGAAAVLADGMGGAKGGRIAAELACRTFLDAYYSLPETLGVAHAGEKALSAFNTWLHGVSHADAAMTGAGTTFSALVLRDRAAHVLHVGDSRIWLMRADTVTQVTIDHNMPEPEHSHILYRALGLEPTLRIDYSSLALEAHDRFLITSDGVHGAMSSLAIQTVLARRGPPDRDAEALCQTALATGSSDNVSAIIVDIIALPDPDYRGLAALAAALPVLPPPEIGGSVDGFVCERLLADGETCRTFVARLGPSGEQRFVLKFPKPNAAPEHAARDAFIREMLIGARLTSPYVAEIVNLAPESQSQVYIVMPFYKGETLEVLLRRGPMGFQQGLDVALKLTRGVSALHRLGVIHRDIKPENILVLTDGGVRLLDLGLARIPNLEDPRGADTPGTQGYIAPELYKGERGGEASDQFAIGVTLYRIFAGRFPYSDLATLNDPGFDSAPDPSQWRPDIPAWLSFAMRRAVQARPEDRYGDVIELAYALETGGAKATPRLSERSLVERNPVLFWKLTTLVLALALLAALIWR